MSNPEIQENVETNEQELPEAIQWALENKEWFEARWYDIENIWVEKLTEERYLIYDKEKDHPIQILWADWEYWLSIDVREWMSKDILKRRYVYPAILVWYKLEFEDWDLRIFESSARRKVGDDWELTKEIEWEKWREIDIFSAEFAEAWDKIDFASKKSMLDLATDLEYSDVSFFNSRWFAKVRDIIRHKELIPDEKFEDELKTAKENLLDQIWDDRYNYLQDSVTRQELDAYFHWWTIEYPRWNEIQIPAWTISEELYELAIQELEEVEQARQEKLKEERKQLDEFRSRVDWMFNLNLENSS